jgi:hypothetical protein
MLDGMEHATGPRETGEFGLFDYARVVWRWRWLVLAGMPGGVLAALLLTMLAGSTYRVVATVDAGDLKEARDRDLDRLAARLNAGLLDQPGRPAGAPPPRVVVQFKRPYTLEMSVETRGQADGMAAMQRATAAALEELNRLHEMQRAEEGVREGALQAGLARLRREQSFREERLQVLRRGLQQLERARAAWARPPDDPVGALIFGQLSEQIAARQLTLTQLEDQIRVQGPREVEELERQLKLAQLTSQTRPPRLVVGPQPVTTRRRLSLPLAVGAVVGLAGSILLAVACEYAQGVRRRAAPARKSAAGPGS